MIVTSDLQTGDERNNRINQKIVIEVGSTEGGNPRGRKAIRPVLFVFATILRRLGGAIWIPLLVARLSDVDLARYGLLQSVLTLSIPALCFNLAIVPTRLVFDYVNREYEFLRTILIATFFCTFIGSSISIGVLYSTPILDPGLVQGNPLNAILIALLLTTYALNEFAFSTLRVRSGVWIYIFCTIVTAFLPIALYLSLSQILIVDQVALLSLSMGLAFAASTLIGVQHKRSIYNSKFSYVILRDSLAFAAPTSVHVVGLWVIANVGRWIGASQIGLDELAPYILLNLLAVAISGIPAAIFESQMAEVGQRFSQREYSSAIDSINFATRYALASVIGMYALLPLPLWILSIMHPTFELPSTSLLILTCSYNVLQAVYFRGVNMLHGLKSSKALAAGTAASAVVAIITTFLLASSHGITGLAFGMTSGMLVQCIIANLLANHELKRVRFAKSA